MRTKTLNHRTYNNIDKLIQLVYRTSAKRKRNSEKKTRHFYLKKTQSWQQRYQKEYSLKKLLLYSSYKTGYIHLYTSVYLHKNIYTYIIYNKVERQSYQTGVSRNASIVLERLRWGFLVACFLEKYHCSSDMFTSAWLQSICLVLNGFGLSPWSLLYAICASWFFGGEKNQEQAHAVTIMSLQLVTFRREGSALKLRW